MKFSDVAGHEKVKADLRHQADAGQLPHAVLLAGPPGIGKMKMARALAQYLHCAHPENGDSCGKCPSCIQHQSLNNPDMHYVYPIVKEKNMAVSTDAMEEWKQMLSEYPYMPLERWSDILQKGTTGNKKPQIYKEESEAVSNIASRSAYKEKLKIFLIWLPETMNLTSANKLLKLVEEPYEDTVFIMVSNEPHLILPTIYSRTQPYNMRPLPTETVAAELETETGLDRQTAWEMARLAEGNMARAMELSGGAEELHEFGDLFRSMMRMAYARQIGGLRRLADTVAGFNRPKTIRFIDYSSRMTRENFIYNLQMPQLVRFTAEETEFARKFAPFIHTGNVEQISGAFADAGRDVAGNANVKMVMFSLGLLLCQYIRTSRPT